jgi:very-short-patch-repair endonuclease
MPTHRSEHRESEHRRGAQIRGAHPDTTIGALAARQHGVAARRQLLAAGLTARMIGARLDSGALVPLHRGVYAVGHAVLRREGFWLAAVLAVGPRAVLSHRAAAALHLLRASGGTKVEVTTPSERRGTPKIRVHPRRRLTAADIAAVDGIPVTSVARTLVDLAETLAPQPLLKALSEAERLNILDVRALMAARARTRGRHGPADARLQRAIEELKATGTQLTRSELEDRFAALVARAGLPRPRLNAQIGGFEVDVLWPAHNLVVELDGWVNHRHRAAFERDRRKGNALLAQGFRVLRFTHRDVTSRAAETAAQITAELSRAAGSARRPRPADRLG